MYFVISVFPISTTSGVFPPASVASSFCRCVPQVWYWTLTVVPGWSFWNWAFAAFTIGSQFAACASTCSQTVMLFAACADVPPDAVDAMIARAPPIRTTAPMMRALMGDSPKRIERRLGRFRSPVARGNASAPRLLVYTTWPQCGTLAQSPTLSRPIGEPCCQRAASSQERSIALSPARRGEGPQRRRGTDQRDRSSTDDASGATRRLAVPPSRAGELARFSSVTSLYRSPL